MPRAAASGRRQPCLLSEGAYGLYHVSWQAAFCKSTSSRDRTQPRSRKYQVLKLCSGGEPLPFDWKSTVACPSFSCIGIFGFSSWDAFCLVAFAFGSLSFDICAFGFSSLDAFCFVAWDPFCVVAFICAFGFPDLVPFCFVALDPFCVFIAFIAFAIGIAGGGGQGVKPFQPCFEMAANLAFRTTMWRA